MTVLLVYIMQARIIVDNLAQTTRNSFDNKTRSNRVQRSIPIQMRNYILSTSDFIK